MVDFDRSAFIGKFREEAGELLQRLNEGIIALESSPGDRDLVEQLLRDAHTLKGSSRMVGLIEISDVAHRLEDLMVRVRDGEVAYAAGMSEVVFDALDAIFYLAEAASATAGQTAVSEEVDVALLLERLGAIGEPRAGGASCEPPGDEDVAPSGGDATSTVAACDDELHPKTQHTIRVRATDVDRLLNLLSEVVITQIKSEQRALDVRVHGNRLGDVWQAWVRVKGALSAVPGGDDVLASLASEIDVLDSVLAERRREAKRLASDYAEDVSRASMVVADVQEQAMHLRMLPANTVFQTFPRAMRDLAKQFGKEIELVIEGGDTELDKKVLEEINDPLVHIMRNAVDHGVESPEVRRAAGKPERGTVRLSAAQEGDHIVIEVSDDGAGIDVTKVREAAVRKGYASASEAASMSDRELMFLIFEPGFSTSAIITEISGRGVGMDVVREFVVERLKGSLDVESQPGVGTTFRLTIPLTLAIIRALLARVGQDLYALPTAAVEETLLLAQSDVIRLEGREAIRRGRRTIPLVRLSDILGVPGAEPAEGASIPIAVVGYSGHRMAFACDGFEGEQQIVIKALGTHLQKVDNVAGVTILGAGDVVPILHVPDLMNNARTRAGREFEAAARAERQGARRVLICEDSFTTRELERSIFEAAGYEVDTAVDGIAGIAKLKDGSQVDAVVTDVQMPNMGGLELTRAIKSDPHLAHVPVVIVTSLEREDEKAEGIEAGADAYITKSVFNQDTLLDTVESLIR